MHSNSDGTTGFLGKISCYNNSKSNYSCLQIEQFRETATGSVNKLRTTLLPKLLETIFPRNPLVLLELKCIV